MGTGELNAGGNPAMDTETGISSGLMGHLVRMQTLTMLTLLFFTMHGSIEMRQEKSGH